MRGWERGQVYAQGRGDEQMQAQEMGNPMEEGRQERESAWSGAHQEACFNSLEALFVSQVTNHLVLADEGQGGAQGCCLLQALWPAGC